MQLPRIPRAAPPQGLTTGAWTRHDDSVWTSRGTRSSRDYLLRRHRLQCIAIRGPEEYQGFAAGQLRTCQSFFPRIVEWEQNSFSRARRTVLNSKLIFETFAARDFWFMIMFKTPMNCYLNNSEISATVTQTAAAHPAPPGCCSPEGCIGRKRGLPPALWRCLALCSPNTQVSCPILRGGFEFNLKMSNILTQRRNYLSCLTGADSAKSNRKSPDGLTRAQSRWHGY